MANKIYQDEIKYIIDVNSSKAQEEVHKLETELNTLKKTSREYRTELTKMEAEGNTKNNEYYNNLKELYNKTERSISDMKGKIAEATNAINVNDMSMRQLRQQARSLKLQLDDTVKSLDPDKYKQLSDRLTEVNERMNDLRISAKSIGETLTDQGVFNVAVGNLFTKVAEYAGKLGAKLADLIGDSIEMARSADGVAKAFNDLDQPYLLDNLRTATKGTVNDLELMKAVVQAKDFRIPLEDLGKYLQFAQLKAQQTGQSVEYMTQSIVTGLGRKSVMILDNLGLSAAEINEQVAKTGDFMKAVASIVDNQLAAAGDNYVSAADKALKATTDLENAQLKLGQALLPYQEIVGSIFSDVAIGLMDLISWVAKTKSAMILLQMAISSFTIYAIASSEAIKKWVTSTKLAKAASIAWSHTLTALKGVLLLCTAGVAKLQGNTIKAAAAMKLFNNSFKAHGIIGFIALLTTAIASMALFTKNTDAASKARKTLADIQEDAKKKAMAERSQLEILTNVVHDNNAALSDRLNAIKRIKDIVPEYTAEISKEGEVYKENKKALDEYTAALEKKYLVEGAKATMQKLGEQKAELTIKREKAAANLSNLRAEQSDFLKSNSGKFQTTGGAAAPGYVNAAMGYTANIQSATTELNKLDNELKNVNETWKLLNKTFGKDIMNSEIPKTTTTTTSTTPKTTPKSAPVPKASALGKKTKEEDPAAALKAQLQALQQYYDQVDEVTAMGEQDIQLTLTAQRQAELETVRAYVQAGLELARQAGADENAIIEAGQRANQAIIKKYADKELQIAQANEEKKQQARQQLGLDQKSELEIQTEQLKEALDQQYITQEEYERRIQKLKKQSYQRQAQLYQQLFSNAVTALQDAEMANVDAKYDAQIEAARQAGEDTTALENKKAQEKLNIEKKYADVNFAIKASQIISDTAVSIMKAYADLGPIAGSVAAALMGITGAAQLAAANAERNRVKKMTLSGSSSSSGSGARVATGLESGGRIDVERRQDGRLFNAYYDPDRRGFVDRPTVIVGEGPQGQSREWVASNAAVTNPTIAPLLDVIDRAQQNGTVRTLDMRRFLALQTAGRATGGALPQSSQPSPSTPVLAPSGASAQPTAALSDKTAAALTAAIDRLATDGVKAIVGINELEARQRLRAQAQSIASKN